VYRPVAAPAGRGIENRSFAERAQVSPPAGDFALAFGFVGLIFLLFPASLGLSDRIEDYFTVFQSGADTMMRDDCGSRACRCSGRVPPYA
jgi:hypothetical protein